MDEGELMSLSEAGITSINLAYGSNPVQQEGAYLEEVVDYLEMFVA